MKKIIIFILFIFHISVAFAQPRFNKTYRIEPKQRNAVAFMSLRVVDNTIYMAGIGVFNVNDTIVSNSGIFTSLDMSGNLLKNTYYGVIPTNSDFNDDVMSTESNNQFSVAGYNFNYSFTHIKIENNGNIVWKKTYSTVDSTTRYGAPAAVLRMSNGYAIFVYQFSLVTNSSSPIVFLTDSEGNFRRTITISEDQRNNVSTHIIENKSKNLTLSLFKSRNRDTDTNYVYISQLREIDTLGTTLWIYNTPKERYIYIKKFVQLANGNYLVWGDEELSRNGRLYRTVYDVFPYLAEINPQQGVVWEKKMQFKARTYSVKLTKDSSILLSGFYDNGFNNTNAFLIKLNKHRDSIFRRNFKATNITSDRVTHYPNQIEELDNGDLLIGGYVWDLRLPAQSTTSGQWGWLVRTDSLGCSLEQSSCRVATKEVEKGPLSINVFPNPTTGSFTVDFSGILPNQKTIFKLYNTVGQLVMTQKLDNTLDKIEFDVSNLTEGFYIFTLQTEGGQVVGNGKLQVQR